MKKVININNRAILILPKEMRQRLGVNGNSQIIAEETGDGALLRAGVTFPVELYSAKRLAEFDRNNEQALARFKFKK
jgi:bifunctional DNA-binding transcriptional regulator/antitoxin component of YhaV-PrlF toxin-antitoxin module